MIADTVYPIVKVLSIEEQIKLFDRLQKDLQGKQKIHKKRKQLVTDDEARNYLIKLLVK
ncbi:MAG: hypothetical protein KGZ87_05555 [Bacteroidetes bacterium]|nr:hypothetical protein [Bacteroidota bacterium]